MGVVGKGADDLHCRLRFGIGRVDDAERRLAARDQYERSADIADHRQLRLDRFPQAELLQSLFGVDPGRHRPDITGCDARGAGQCGEVEVRIDGHAAQIRFFAGDQNERVAK
jgi:hypothetical protein